MSWELDFITEDEFRQHVCHTIKKYGIKLESVGLNRFNKNVIDPIKLIFDKYVYRTDWNGIISNEIFRRMKLVLQVLYFCWGLDHTKDLIPLGCKVTKIQMSHRKRE